MVVRVTCWIRYLLQRSLLLLLLLALGLLKLLLAEVQECLDLLGHSVLGGKALQDSLASDQTGDNACAHDEGQHEPVHAVPVRRQAATSRPGVVVVQEDERKELADERILHGEQQRGPGHRRSDAASRVSPEAVLAAVSSPLKTPVDGTEERENLSIVRKLEKSTIQEAVAAAASSRYLPQHRSRPGWAPSGAA